MLKAFSFCCRSLNHHAASEVFPKSVSWYLWGSAATTQLL